jgi:hypothetical protein
VTIFFGVMILALPVSILTQNFADHDEIIYDDEQLTATTPNQKPIFDDDNTSVHNEVNGGIDSAAVHGKTL